MKLFYGGPRNQRNFLEGIRQGLGFDSRVFHSYHALPLSLNSVGAVVLTGDMNSFFGSDQNFGRFVSDVERDRVGLIYVGRYFGEGAGAISHYATLVKASNRPLRKICRDIRAHLNKD